MPDREHRPASDALVLLTDEPDRRVRQSSDREVGVVLCDRSTTIKVGVSGPWPTLGATWLTVGEARSFAQDLLVMAREAEDRGFDGPAWHHG